MSLKRLTVWNSDGTPELYVQVDAAGVKLAQMYDRLQAELVKVAAELDILRNHLCKMVDAGCDATEESGDRVCHYCCAWLDYNQPHDDGCVYAAARKLVMGLQDGA